MSDYTEVDRLVSCAECGTKISSGDAWWRAYRDAADTDRGDEIREGREPVCTDCAATWGDGNDVDAG